MPDGPGLELLRGEIDVDAPGAVLATSYAKERAVLIVDAAKVRDVLTWLRDTPGQGYRFLSSLHVADYLPAEPRFGVHYEMLNRDRVERIRVKAMLPGPSGSTAPRRTRRSTRSPTSSRPPTSRSAKPSTSSASSSAATRN